METIFLKEEDFLLTEEDCKLIAEKAKERGHICVIGGIEREVCSILPYINAVLKEKLQKK